MCLALLPTPSAAQSTNPSTGPFLRYRDLTLDYTGPNDDLTNLTEIRIGWFGPTNVNDPLTGTMWWAANLAVQEANQQKIAPTSSASPMPQSTFASLPIRLVPRWSVDPWGTGVSQLTRMVYDQQPLALMGSVDSAATHLAEQVVAKAQLPLVSPIATDKSVTLAGVSWMFACAPTDAAIARVLVTDVLAQLQDTASAPATAMNKMPELVLWAGTDHESRMMAREVVREFSRRGRLPDYRFDLPVGTTDFSQLLLAWEQSPPAIILIVASPEDSARMVRAVRAGTSQGTSSEPAQLHAAQTGPGKAEDRGPIIFGSQAMARTRFRELAGPAAEGVRFPLLFNPGNIVGITEPVPPNSSAQAQPPKASRVFWECFYAEHRRWPDYTAVLTYDATRLLIEAIHRAGPNRSRIREALIQLSPWPGLAGPIQFDGTGQNTRTTISMGTISNRIVVPLAAERQLTQTTPKE